MQLQEASVPLVANKRNKITTEVYEELASLRSLGSAVNTVSYDKVFWAWDSEISESLPTIFIC